MNAQATISNREGETGRFLPDALLRAPRLVTARSADRVVAMAALSDRIPDRFIAETFAHTLFTETGVDVLLISLELDNGTVNLQDWPTMRVNGGFCFAEKLEDLSLGQLKRLRVRVSPEFETRGHLDGLVRHALEFFPFVILRAGPELPESLWLECFSVAARSFLFLQPTSENLYNRDLLLREIRQLPPSPGLKLQTIVCREKGEDHFNDHVKQMGESVDGFVHGCPTPNAAQGVRRWPDRHFNADIRRLARTVSRRRLGLALSSGGARGLAHIGVIQVLEENGIEVDCIAGCSMGSYIGAVWAYGYDGVGMEKLAREFEHRWGLFQLIDPFILPRQGFLRGEKVKGRLKRSIGNVHFSELVRPLRVVATHLATLDRVVFSSGEVAAAVHASSAIPGACVPVSIDGELYIDGGIADPLPVDVLQEMGIERILAVNTIPTPAYLREREQMLREQSGRFRRNPHPLRALCNRYLNYFAPGNILDTILRSFNGAQMRVAEQSCPFADLVIRPLTMDGRWHDFRHPGKYIAVGRRVAEEQLHEIKALVNRRQTYELKHA